MADYTILGSAGFIEAFQNSMRQEMLKYYNNLPSHLVNPQTTDESFKKNQLK